MRTFVALLVVAVCASAREPIGSVAVENERVVVAADILKAIGNEKVKDAWAETRMPLISGVPFVGRIGDLVAKGIVSVGTAANETVSEAAAYATQDWQSLLKTVLVVGLSADYLEDSRLDGFGALESGGSRSPAVPRGEGESFYIDGSGNRISVEKLSGKAALVIRGNNNQIKQASREEGIPDGFVYSPGAGN